MSLKAKNIPKSPDPMTTRGGQYKALHIPVNNTFLSLQYKGPHPFLTIRTFPYCHSLQHFFFTHSFVPQCVFLSLPSPGSWPLATIWGCKLERLQATSAYRHPR
jgi:hypothetical protein